MDTDLIYNINQETKIMPYFVKLDIPDFSYHSLESKTYTLSFKQIESQDWFLEFSNLVISKIGKGYLPIVRLSDGEYKFLLGEINPYKKSINIFRHLYFYIKYIFNAFSKFEAKTKGIYTSGIYSRKEIELEKKNTINNLRLIAKHGILALHLTYTRKPFQEYYHRPLSLFFKNNSINLTNYNYYPFYFVYALLRGSMAGKILKDRTILIIHGADDKKKINIITSLKKLGVKKVYWISISSSHSLFDKIVLKTEHYNSDLVLIGAGIGKFNIFPQLINLNRPCIDAGFVFEAWANEDNKWHRAFMVPDSEWDINKVRFLN